MRIAQQCARRVSSVFRNPYGCRRLSGTAYELTDELSARGMISQMTNQECIRASLKNPRTLYLGVDPTAKSLHVGHLLPLMVLLHFHLHGHNVIPLIGGATGLVGDPSGKLEERTLLGEQKVVDNVQSLTDATTRFFETATLYAESRLQRSLEHLKKPSVANNVEWLGSLSLLEFLRKAGRHARVPTMLRRDSVQIRMESQQGLSFTEFTYQLLQAFDFYHLHKTRGCTLQLGGSDQWGNILAGVELIDRIARAEAGSSGSEDNAMTGRESAAHGITTPLLTTSTGAKFGKSAGNAVWLDRRLTSVLDFYQFFLRTADADVGTYLRMFTLLPLQRIEEALEEHESTPDKRTAQRLLASEVVELVHGNEAVENARMATQLLFENTENSSNRLSAHAVVSALAHDPRLSLCARDAALTQPIWRLAATHGLVSSNSEAKRLAGSGGLYVNNTPANVTRTLAESDLIDGSIVILRAGKDRHCVLAMQ